MTWLSKLAVGMPVYTTDGLLGSIVSVPRVDLGDPSAPAEVIVLASQENSGPGVEEFRRVTREMVERVEPGGAYLNLARREVPPASEAVSAAHRQLRDGDSHLTLPLVEEQIQVGKRVVELGHLSVRKKVDEILDERAVTLQHQQVEVERVPRDEVIPEFIEPYMDGDVYVVPVIEEEVVVQTRLRLKEELRIKRTVGTHEELLRTPVRRERVLVEEHWHDQDGHGAEATTSPATPEAETQVYRQ